jgi:hypothetical protein
MQKQHELNKNKTSILDFKKHFYELNGRDALDSEVIDNLKDKIDYNIIIKILDNIKYTFHSDIDI